MIGPHAIAGMTQKCQYCLVSLQDVPLDTNAFSCTVCKMSQATQYKLVYIHQKGGECENNLVNKKSVALGNGVVFYLAFYGCDKML